MFDRKLKIMRDLVMKYGTGLILILADGQHGLPRSEELMTIPTLTDELEPEGDIPLLERQWTEIELLENCELIPVGREKPC